MFVLAGEKSARTPVNEVGGWIVFRADGGSDGGLAARKTKMDVIFMIVSRG